MWMFYTLAFSLTVILDSIELSLQSDFPREGSPIYGVCLNGSSSTPDVELPPARHPPPAEPLLRGRSRSPRNKLAKRARSRSFPASTSSTDLSFPSVLGYALDHLPFIRLTPRRNLERHFGLRKYTFPSDKPIKVHLSKGHYGPVPSREQIVLSTSEGDVFAILESNDCLAGIYAYVPNRGEVRARINVETERIGFLTDDEIWEIPVGQRRKVILNFSVEYVNPNL